MMRCACLQCVDSASRFIRSGRALQAAARFLKTVGLKRCSSPAWEGAPMSDQSTTIPPTTSAASSPAIPPGRPVAARTKLLLEGQILTTLLRLAAPNVLNLLAFVGVITFDGFFLGRIGTDALAGASLAFPWIMLVLQTTNSGMGAGVSSAVARALGAGKRETADELASHAFLLALVLGGIFSTVMLLAAPFIFGWMGGRDKMLMDALSYANVAFGGALCITVLNLLGNAVRGTGNMSLLSPASSQARMRLPASQRPPARPYAGQGSRSTAFNSPK